MTLLIKQTNVVFIVFYHKPILPCKECRGQLSEVFNHQLAQKLVADAAQNLLATTITCYFNVHSPNKVFIQFLHKPCNFSFYTINSTEKDQNWLQFSLCLHYISSQTLYFSHCYRKSLFPSEYARTRHGNPCGPECCTPKCSS